ncbi:MAG: methyltransferase domain-containing protein [Bacteroidota bacterium]
MGWYDSFSRWYDFLVTPHYKKARKIAIEQMGIKEGDMVLDLACGTGPNFEHLSPLVGNIGLVIGVDYSKGMIKKAQKKIDKNKWENIVLVQEDAKQIDKTYITGICGREVQLDNLICVLGFSVIREHLQVMTNMYDLLKPGGTFAIVDIFADKFVPQSWYVQKVASADLKRKSWEFLQKNCEDYSLSYLSRNRHLHGGLLYLASGKKR